MKTKSAKQPKQSKRTVKDMKPKKNATGGHPFALTGQKGALMSSGGTN